MHIAIALFLSAGTSTELVAQANRQLERLPPAGVSTEKRLALVIGNSRYVKVSPLTNPSNDATDMAVALQGLGFEVIRGTDANLVQMRRLIREFGEKLAAGKGVGLFYYAGHGVEVSGKNYLVPVDADISREVETEDYAIDLNSIMRQMDSAGNGFNIVVLDACRNNPFSRGWNRSGDAGGLAVVNAPTGTYIAYAAAPGFTASDGKGSRNGLFTGALLKNIRRPGLKLEEVFKATREDVMRQTGSQQVPWDSSSVKGDFYFRISTASLPAATVEQTPARSNSTKESAAWELVQASSDPEDYRSFLAEFPNGVNAEAARVKVDDLTWAAAKNSNDSVLVQKYLDAFPAGRNSKPANELLEALRAQPAARAGSLGGTVWSATSPGGDKRYRFDFYEGGSVLCTYYWKGSTGTPFKGTWQANGEKLTLDIQKLGAMDVTITGDKMTGTFRGGKYNFSGERFNIDKK